MSLYELWFCVVATIYTCIPVYGIDVCYNIYKNNEEEDDDSDEELPEHIKRMYA